MLFTQFSEAAQPILLYYVNSLPYCCNFCKSTFSQAIALARHKNFYHGSKETTVTPPATSLFEKKKENNLALCNDMKPLTFENDHESKNTLLSINALPMKIEHKNEVRLIKVYHESKSFNATFLPIKLENKNENTLKFPSSSGTSYELKNTAISIKNLPTKIEHKYEDVLKLQGPRLLGCYSTRTFLRLWC